MTYDTVEVFDAVWSERPQVLLLFDIIFLLVNLEPLRIVVRPALRLLEYVSETNLGEELCCKLAFMLLSSHVAFSRVVLFKVDVVRNA